MSSGDAVGKLQYISPTGANSAVMGIRVGGSTPAERIRTWRFADGVTNYIDFVCQLQGYDGGGLTVTLAWSALTATTGNARLGAAFRAIPPDAEDIDASHTYDFNLVTATTANVAGEWQYSTITFTNGADMDNLADGNWFVLRIERVGGDGADSLTDTLELNGVSISET